MPSKLFLEMPHSDPKEHFHNEIRRLNKRINERDIQIKNLLAATKEDEKAIRNLQKQINAKNQQRLI